MLAVIKSVLLACNINELDFAEVWAVPPVVEVSNAAATPNSMPVLWLYRLEADVVVIGNVDQACTINTEEKALASNETRNTQNAVIDNFLRHVERSEPTTIIAFVFRLVYSVVRVFTPKHKMPISKV